MSYKRNIEGIAPNYDETLATECLSYPMVLSAIIHSICWQPTHNVSIHSVNKFFAGSLAKRWVLFWKRL